MPWFCLWSLIGAYPGYTYLYFSKFPAFNFAFDVASIIFSLCFVMWFFMSIMSARKRALFSLLIKVLSVCGSFLLCSNTSSTGCLRLVRNCVISLSFLLGLLIRRLGNKQLKYIKLGLDATKPVFGVSEKVRLKPVSSATETRKLKFRL